MKHQGKHSLQFYKLIKVMDDPLTYLMEPGVVVDFDAADICKT
jgi:hypothetical protein